MAKPKTKDPQHNYIRKLLYLQKIGALPRDVGVHLFEVYHDTWCGLLQGKRCNCAPDIKLTCARN